MIEHTSTKVAPWYVVPADNKWFTRFAVARIIYAQMKALNPQYPTLDAAQKKELEQARVLLEKETA
ncbi:MAG: hypothetical protein WKF37_05405 [Bryobacteraceae bacterium]